ncbi:response regulator [Noviherbaspirillum malthae]|uniref:response regulator n=1 Tax=Noviherbaspirillum malthae TaxID=1260987 RepID=UPI00188EE7CB|nr:response regulator transcription factor [Noviherbaspirillum malthae]
MVQETSREPIGVMIVEDDAVTRKALSLAIESDPRLKLLDAVESVKDALAWLDVNVPQVLMTDLGLPDGSGIEVIHACTSRHPQTDIMVVTMSSDEANVLACIEAGASGYVLKDAGKTDIARAVLDLRSGGAPMSPAIARMVLAKVRGDKKPVAAREQDPATSLTKRESAILDLIARGDSYGEVAKILSVSVGTVQTHIKNIYGKLAVHSRGEAVFEAHRRGLLQIGQPRVPK